MKKELGVLLLVFIAAVGFSGVTSTILFTQGIAQVSTISNGAQVHPTEVQAGWMRVVSITFANNPLKDQSAKNRYNKLYPSPPYKKTVTKRGNFYYLEIYRYAYPWKK